jgi:hypothetical protein
VDLAAWVSDLGCLRQLQRARSGALNQLLADRDIGVAHHQVDVFVIEAGAGLYLGRLCDFTSCPKKGRMECMEPGCGDTPHLRQHDSFRLPPEAVRVPPAVALFDREREAGV